MSNASNDNKPPRPERGVDLLILTYIVAFAAALGTLLLAYIGVIR